MYNNSIFRKYPLIGKVFGFFTLVVAFYCAAEWNEVTDSYWGFVYLVIALPGLFLPLIKAVMKKKN